jgi:hypothetical protein
MIKAAPNQIKALVANEVDQPLNSVYRDNLALFTEAAATNLSQRFNMPYRPLTTRIDVPSFARNPMICWSYGSRQTEDQVGVLRANIPGVQETTIKGKPAFLAQLNVAQMPFLLTTNPITTTATNSQCINIEAFKAYRFLWKHIVAILKTNQYAYMANSGSGPQVEIDNTIFCRMPESSANVSSERDSYHSLCYPQW